MSLLSRYMTQLRDCVSLHVQLNGKMWLFKVFGVIYMTSVCASQEDVTFVDRVMPTTNVPTLRPYVPPVPNLQQSTAWLDFFFSENVELRCTVTDSTELTFTWYRNGRQISPGSDISLSEDQSVLKFTATAQTDSGIYFCEVQHKTRRSDTKRSNDLALKVYEKPRLTLSRSSNYIMFPDEAITFTCKVDLSSGWEYLWDHNGMKIVGANDNTYKITSIKQTDKGQYSCKARRGQLITEASETTVLEISDPPTPTLKLLTPWPDVFKNEAVEFRCEVSSPDWTFIWFRNEQQLQSDTVQTLKVDGTFTITSVSQIHQGTYKCKVQLTSRNVQSDFSKTVDVTVYENLPKPFLSKDPGFHPMYAMEIVTFTCKVNMSTGWKHQWYKDGHQLSYTTESVKIPLKSSDGGEYHCKATRNTATLTPDSEKIQLNVLDIPVPTLTQMPKWPQVFPTEKVKLSCVIQQSSSDWTYTWTKDAKEVQADDTVSFNMNAATLSISSASAKDKGQYNCRGNLLGRSVKSNSSSQHSLHMYDQKPTVVLKQDPEYKVMFPGESLKFTCDVSVSVEWEYLWYKDGSLLSVSSKEYSLKIDGTTHMGSYACAAKRSGVLDFTTDLSQAIHLEVKENKPKPIIAQQPNAEKLYKGESVLFQCNVEISSGWSYVWYIDGSKHVTESSDLEINDLSSLNNGIYECKAIRDKTRFETEHSDKRALNISEIPVPSISHITPWLDVFPNEYVKLSCGMQQGSSDWTYTWHKDAKEVQADNTVSFESDQAVLNIRHAIVSQGGNYSCSGKLKSRPVNSSFSSELKLDVYGTQPQATLMQNPEHNLMHSGDSVSFSCHINVSSGWEYLWYKAGSKLGSSRDTHNISSVMTKDTGSYTCQAQRGASSVFSSKHSEAAMLSVEERPKASIILLTGWGEVFSTDSLVLKCEVMESNVIWNYTWFKGEIELSSSSTEKYTVTPQNDPEQSVYTCKGIRNDRPLYSKSSDPLKTKNLLLKRRVLLSITGCIFFGIIAVFIGCIALRVFRKPASYDEKPEDINLFPTMAQLKITDASCPLVEYITDAALNAPAKEEEENGTVCNETTPLPITKEEDEAAKTDSQDTAEKNGGLVSFQQ